MTASCTVLGPRSTLDLPGLRAVDVVSWDPIRVVGGSRRHRRAVRSFARRSFALLGRTRRLLGELGALSGLALLGEIGGDPNGVDEIANTTEAGQNHEVKEEAVAEH